MDRWMNELMVGWNGCMDDHINNEWMDKWIKSTWVDWTLTINQLMYWFELTLI